MRRNRVLIPLAIGSVAMVVACNAIIGLSGDYDYDAGAPSIDAHVADSSVSDSSAVVDGTVFPDSTAPDGSSDSDVPTDSGPPGPASNYYPSAFDRAVSQRDASLDAASGYDYCVDQGNAPEFCWSFEGVFAGDTTDLTKQGWTSATTGASPMPEDAGPSSVMDVRVTSAPNIDAGVDESVALPYEGRVATLAAGGAKALTLGFSMQVVQADTQATIAVLGVGSSSYGLVIYPQGWFGLPMFGDNAAPAREPDFAHAAPFQLNVWYRVAIHLAVNDSGVWSGSISVGGKLVGVASSSALSTGTPPPAGAGLSLGVFSTATPLGTTEVMFDDVLFDPN